jgi:hypothetical protein
MNKKVSAIYIGIPHWLASCQDCDWTAEYSANRKYGYREVRKHVSKTGHTVAVESSHHTHYCLEDKE